MNQSNNTQPKIIQKHIRIKLPNLEWTRLKVFLYNMSKRYTHKKYRRNNPLNKTHYKYRFIWRFFFNKHINQLLGEPVIPSITKK